MVFSLILVYDPFADHFYFISIICGFTFSEVFVIKSEMLL